MGSGARRYYFPEESRPRVRYSVDLRDLGTRIAGGAFVLFIVAVFTWAYVRNGAVY